MCTTRPRLMTWLDHGAADADQVGQHAVDDDGVELLAGFEAADRILRDRSTAAALMVAPISASSSVMFMPKQASDITNGIDVREAAAGIEIGGEGDGDAVFDQHPRRRKASELQEERRRRQQRRHDVAIREQSARARSSTKIR